VYGPEGRCRLSLATAALKAYQFADIWPTHNIDRRHSIEEVHCSPDTDLLSSPKAIVVVICGCHRRHHTHPCLHYAIIFTLSLTKFPFNQVTVIKGDAADEQTIQDLVSLAVTDEGRLDVFFANVRSHLTLSSPYTLSMNSTEDFSRQESLRKNRLWSITR
jgi:hypothetical protein